MRLVRRAQGKHAGSIRGQVQEVLGGRAQGAFGHRVRAPQPVRGFGDWVSGRPGSELVRARHAANTGTRRENRRTLVGAPGLGRGRPRRRKRRGEFRFERTGPDAARVSIHRRRSVPVGALLSVRDDAAVANCANGVDASAEETHRDGRAPSARGVLRVDERGDGAGGDGVGGDVEGSVEGGVEGGVGCGLRVAGRCGAVVDRRRRRVREEGTAGAGYLGRVRVRAVRLRRHVRRPRTS
mmetsp:Transcript_4936/g.22098  ORF Transcript_4936/g.22098 Transcript_4936/m.22098 type:complete len:239 (-) Transcript_4936:1683-2399(-)